VKAIEIDGYWRLLRTEYAAEVFDMILTTLSALDRDINQFSSSACVKALSAEFPPLVLAHVLRMYGQEAVRSHTLSLLEYHFSLLNSLLNS
jgi:Sister chromatid cohesion protein Dcc1